MDSVETSAEAAICADYIDRAEDEADFESVSPEILARSAIFVVEGFEERSVGILESIARRRLKAEKVVIAQYTGTNRANAKYRNRFNAAANAVGHTRSQRVQTSNDGGWIEEALQASDPESIIIDITGISNRALFGVLDALAQSRRNISVAYTEAGQYWPTHDEWEELRKELSSDDDLSDVMDAKPWLFGYEHKCELIPGHEGYDSAGTSRAMLAFLPFKAARLAAVLGQEEYSSFLFIAGRPRLSENAWRVDALKAINANLIVKGELVEMDTFGYRHALEQLTYVLFSKPGLLKNYDVHMASMGSKLQEVACWVLSTIVPSLTVLTAVPAHYYAAAFSSGIGARWIFPLLMPYSHAVRSSPVTPCAHTQS